MAGCPAGGIDAPAIVGKMAMWGQGRLEKAVDMTEFKNANAVIVGGGNGIGHGLVRTFAKRGANVLVADIRLKAAREAAGEAARSGGGGEAFSVFLPHFSRGGGLAGRG